MLGAAALASPAVFTDSARAKAIHLKITHNSMPDTAAHVVAATFQKFMAERGEGRFDVEIFGYSMLGNEVQAARALVEGTVDGCVSPNGILGTYVEENALVEYPYLFADLAHARASLTGKLGTFVASKLEAKGMIVIGWSENGMRHITANRAIRTPADLKGLKLRVQPIKMHVEVFNRLGATAGPLIWTELPSAMRAGQFEAQENPIINTAANDFLIQMQTHLSMTGHVYSPYPFVFSKETFKRLARKDQELVVEAGATAAKASIKYLDDAYGPAIARLKAGGMTIVTDVDVPAFMRAVQDLNADMARHMNADALQGMRKLIA